MFGLDRRDVYLASGLNAYGWKGTPSADRLHGLMSGMLLRTWLDMAQTVDMLILFLGS